MNQTKIYVGNLSYDVTSDQLRDFFGQYGPVTEVKLITDFNSGQSKGFAFVTFESEAGVKGALDANGATLEGRSLKVNTARDRDNNRQAGRGRGRSQPQNQDESRW